MHAVAGHGVARHSVARGMKGWHVMARHGTVCGGLVGSAMQGRCRWKGGSGARVGSDGRGGARHGCDSVAIATYIYIYRERERERPSPTTTALCAFRAHAWPTVGQMCAHHTDEEDVQRRISCTIPGDSRPQSRSRLACPWINGEACAPSPARRAVPPYAWPHAPDCRTVAARSTHTATAQRIARARAAPGRMAHRRTKPAAPPCHRLRQPCSKLLTYVCLRGVYAGSTGALPTFSPPERAARSRPRREFFRSRHSIRAPARIASLHAASTCAGVERPAGAHFVSNTNVTPRTDGTDHLQNSA